METLDERESRSSLAGVFMAAALEGAAVYDFVGQGLPHLEEIPEAVGQVLSRIDLPAVPGLDVATAQAAAPPHAAGEYPAVLPDHFGQDGSGGAAPAEDLALLHNRRVTLDPDAIADLKSGRIDPRVASVLTAVSRDHDITVSAMMSDHDKLTSGGSVSNHYYGRAVDIATIDGQPVGPSNQVAREVALSLSRLDPSIRPTEIGSPWALPGPAYFTDAAHQNHLHVGFDDPIAPSWAPPDDLSVAHGVSQEAGGDLDDEDYSSDEDSSDDEDEVDEPGGLEDPGGDTAAEADAESDGDDDDGEEDEDDEDEDEEDEDDEDEEGSDGAGAEPSGAAEPPLDLGSIDGSYPGDDASQAEIAAWMGNSAQKRGLPPELPVMAGLVESNLRNLGYGDADSVGFFQMRVSIWNQGDYAGYPESPEKQLDWFLDQAVAVKRQGGGSSDPSGYGEWVANVERPAAQYRGRYQLRLDEARSLLKQGMEGRGAGGAGDGVQLEPVAADGARRAGPRAGAALAEARKYIGTPYRWGGSTPQTGFDCSGLVQWAYARAGIRIPRVTDQQFDAPGGMRVGREQLVPGDLVFFRDPGGYIHHVGISLGGDRFLHAPHTGDVVKTSSLEEPYYAQQFAGGRRFDRVPAGRAQAAVAQGGYADGVDPQAASEAEAALARDAAEAQQPGTLLFEAVRAQEARKANAAAGYFRAVQPGS